MNSGLLIRGFLALVVSTSLGCQMVNSVPDPATGFVTQRKRSIWKRQ